jgi:hypothetical protein
MVTAGEILRLKAAVTIPHTTPCMVAPHACSLSPFPSWDDTSGDEIWRCDQQIEVALKFVIIEVMEARRHCGAMNSTRYYGHALWSLDGSSCPSFPYSGPNYCETTFDPEWTMDRSMSFLNSSKEMPLFVRLFGCWHHISPSSERMGGTKS